MKESHIDPEELVAYVRGDLRRRRAGEVRDHCSACDDCGSQLAAVLLIREAHGVEPPERFRWQRYAAAAATVTLLAAGPVLWSLGSAQIASQPVAVGPGPAAIHAEREAVALPDSLVTGLDAVLWSIRQEAGLALPASTTSASAVIAGSAEHLDAGRVQQAITELAPLAGDSDPRVDLLLGIAELLRDNVEAATRSLERSSSGPADEDAAYETYRRAARLFLAEARHRNGDREGARQQFEALVSHYGGLTDWIGDAARGRLEELGGVATTR